MMFSFCIQLLQNSINAESLSAESLRYKVEHCKYAVGLESLNVILLVLCYRRLSVR